MFIPASLKTKELTWLTSNKRDCQVRTDIHSDFQLVSLEVRNLSADHRLVVLLRPLVLSDREETLKET